MQFLRNVTLAVGLAILASCFGQSTIYFDRGQFDAAVSTLTGVRTDVNFEPPLPPGGIAEFDGVRYLSPVTISGLTFRSGGALFIRFISASDNRVLNGYDSLSPLMVDMNGPTLAFGADFSSYLSPFYTSFLATVTLNDGRAFTFTAPADPNFTFWGIVTTQPFSSLTFSDGGIAGTPPPLHEEILDNITVVRVSEPGVFALLALGVLFLGSRLFEKRRR
jgi:hypothetical protein